MTSAAGGGRGVPKIRMKVDRGRGVSGQFGHHVWGKAVNGLD